LLLFQFNYVTPEICINVYGFPYVCLLLFIAEYSSSGMQRGSRPGPPRGSAPGARPPGGRGGSSADQRLRFEGEFDFESSNAQFDKDQIEKELKDKLTIGKSKNFKIISVLFY